MYLQKLNQVLTRYSESSSFLVSYTVLMTHGINTAVPLYTKVNQIMGSLVLQIVPSISCDYCRSLDECLVKLGTVIQKKFEIDVMARHTRILQTKRTSKDPIF